MKQEQEMKKEVETKPIKNHEREMKEGKMNDRERKQKGGVALVNYWTGAVLLNESVTWGDIEKYCARNVHPSAWRDWRKEARKAFDKEDGKTLFVLMCS